MIKDLCINDYCLYHLRIDSRDAIPKTIYTLISDFQIYLVKIG